MVRIDRVHAEKVKFKAGDNGRSRLRSNAVRFRNKFHKELRTVAADISDEYYGLVSFPVYGEAGLRCMERLRDRSLKLYGRCDVVSLVKTFYGVMLDNSEVTATAAVEFEIRSGVDCADKVEKTWEVAR